jgi:DNA helicase-2/ATP-dependent DNA helicase PcrA
MQATYLEGPLGSGKTARLVECAQQTLQSAPTESVLVLCANHARQQAFTERLRAAHPWPTASFPVYTYQGWVRNTLFNFWPLVEATLQQRQWDGQPVITPELSGMEETEWLLHRLVEQRLAMAPLAFADFMGSRQGLVKQLVRRIRLRSENRLTRQEMTHRSALIGEICQDDTAWIEQAFDKASYALRVLDANKQLDVFHSWLESNPTVPAWMHARVKHLLVDDVDETIPAQQTFITFLAPHLDTMTLAADIEGGSRRGYLNAYPYDWPGLKALCPGDTVILNRDDPMAQNAQALLSAWKHPELGHQPLQAPHCQRRPTAMTRVEMLDSVVDDVIRWLGQGVLPGDIAVVLPKIDLIGQYHLTTALQRLGVPVQVLSGTQRPLENPTAQGWLALLQWARQHVWQTPLGPLDWLVLGKALLGLSGDDLDHWQKAMPVVAYRLPVASDDWLAAVATLPESIQTPLDTLQRWWTRTQDLDTESLMLSAFETWLAPHGSVHGNPAQGKSYYALLQLLDSYRDQHMLYSRWQAVNLPAANDATLPPFEHAWLAHVKAGVVADTPAVPTPIDPEAIVIGTPQKLIDVELRRRRFAWLDLGSREWARTDNAPLYHAWVHSAVWDGSTTALEESFNAAVVRARAAHITRTLMLLATEQITGYTSELDDWGFVQNGLLDSLFDVAPLSGPALVQAIQRATLRDDQAPVLAYRLAPDAQNDGGGTMAITAVPGAGKTFVTVELILAQIAQGVPPEQILVLTYMDAAAKTLLGRLKSKLPAGSALPVVSTIHSLALRILTDTDHALHLGFLPDDVTILDEFAQAEVLGAIAAETLPESGKAGSWLATLGRGIGQAKSWRLLPDALAQVSRAKPQWFRLKEFVPGYQAYQSHLRQHGMLDFNDLILGAIQLLEAHPDIRAAYQQRFALIIEDEAQDSSALLQDFLRLLSRQPANLVRVGDTNQSITTTFSTAEPAVFRDFIAHAQRVVQMTHSSRCAPPIIDLANAWLLASQTQPGLESAFVPTQMQPVLGANPSLLEPLACDLYDTQENELQALCRHVVRLREIYAPAPPQDNAPNAVQTLNPEAAPTVSMAILVRTNAMVQTIAGRLQQLGVPTLAMADGLQNTAVFRVLLAALQVMVNPHQPGLQADLYHRWVDTGVLAPSPSRQTAMTQTPWLGPVRPTQALGQDADLWQRYYDLLDFQRDILSPNLPQLMIRMAQRWFTAPNDRSQGYLCALYAEQLLQQRPPLDSIAPLTWVIDGFEGFIQGRRGRRGFVESNPEALRRFVQVMSLHKSKGQEFDVVFMPGLTQDHFPDTLDAIRCKDDDRLVLQLGDARALLAGEPAPSVDKDAAMLALKRTKLQEEARLVYVGLTRAKQALFLSAHQQSQNRYGKPQAAAPSLIHRFTSDYLAPLAPESEAASIQTVAAPHPTPLPQGGEGTPVGLAGQSVT